MTHYYITLLCIFFLLILLIGAFIFTRFKRQQKYVLKFEQSPKAATLNETLALGGFFYAPKDDAFYSTKDSPKKQFGYCHLYDDALALIGMIVDCEQIPFEYDGTHWLVAFWKGQYAMASGCQIGIYNTCVECVKAPGFQGIFYGEPANDTNLLISYSLKKKNKTLLRSKFNSFFASGMKVGEFSTPSSLSLKANIVFPNKKMLEAFVCGLKEAGYRSCEYCVWFKSVTIHFTKPHTTQPASRTRIQETIIQQGNKKDCETYHHLTAKCTNTAQKLELLKDLDQELYDKIFKSVYAKELYSSYESIHPVLKKNSTLTP